MAPEDPSPQETLFWVRACIASWSGRPAQSIRSTTKVGVKPVAGNVEILRQTIQRFFVRRFPGFRSIDREEWQQFLAQTPTVATIRDDIHARIP